MAEGFVEQAAALRGSGVSIDGVLQELRHAGASPIECIKVMRGLEGVSLGDAKELVDASPAWADVRDQNNEFRRRVIEAMDEDLR